MRWKQELSDYARQVFGVFGSECGREWALPHSDFFEGLTGVSGTYYADASLPNKLGATVVPLFEIVYRDCIAMYGKYGYNPTRSAGYVLHHISIGRPLNYHSIPPHLYWQQQFKSSSQGAQITNATALFTRSDRGWAEGLHPMDVFIKNTYEVLSPLNELTSQMKMTQHQFLRADRLVQRTVFGNGARAVEVVVNGGTNQFTYKSKSAGTVTLPPFGFVIDSPTFAAFHALSWNELMYKEPTLFTLRSLDERPLSRSKSVRVYHAFGPNEIRVEGKTLSVDRESFVGR